MKRRKAAPGCDAGQFQLEWLAHMILLKHGAVMESFKEGKV